MTIMICRDCGERVKVRRFETCCTECGSEDLEPEDAYDRYLQKSTSAG